MTDFTKVCVISNSRAEAGPLESVIAAMPGCYVAKYDSSGLSPTVAMSQALTFYTVVYAAEKPKIVVVLGDRYEMLAAALAALFMKIPIAHIHGGETTTGAFDNSMRHAISHMADIHFVATDDFAMKLVKMGIHPYTITTSGAPGLDGVEGNSAKRDRKLILVTYHPVTRLADNGMSGLVALCKALKEYDGYDITFTGVNNDPGCDEFREYIKLFCVNSSKKTIKENLNHQEYIALMQHAAVVVGNSSAALIEAPWVGVPSINIGERQNGRPLSSSVFSSMDDMGHALMLVNDWNPAYRGGAAAKIVGAISTWLDK
jgi:UDP-hydrolysing UDP-N-acetyl-D-glucosamine 2-epimerase